MLAIEVEFLTGRYVATAYNSRTDSEWPPHPARLFSALVATHFESDEPSPDERATLEWLEAQGAPAIRASGASAREVVTVFVPVNDAGMTDVDAEAEQAASARADLETAMRGGEPKAIKTATTALAKADKRLSAAIARNVAAPKKAMKPTAGLRVLPEYRTRQPRTFPSMSPEEPRVVYVWPGATPTEEHLAAIDRLLSRLVRVGHSSSLAAGRLVNEPPPPTWWPSDEGESILRTVQRGQLAALERSHALHHEIEPRVMPARFQAYTRRSPETVENLACSSFSADWLVLRHAGGASLPIVATPGVARALRRALMSHASDPIPEILSGHKPEGGPSENAHVAVVPLSFVGRNNATGSIIGIALVLPRAASLEDRAAVYAAIKAWADAVRIADEDTPKLALALGAAGVLELKLLDAPNWDTSRYNLRASTWSRPADTWHSVTPVALDRNPGDLRARDRTKQQAAIAEAAATIRQSCVRIGLPEPQSVEILPAAPVAGTAKATHYRPYPEAPGRTRRVLTHATIRFGEAVGGPILLGAGRFHGLGLFRPEVNDE